MKIKLITIHLDVSKRRTRVLAALAALVLVSAVGAVASAEVERTWQDGDVLLAADLNQNFAALDERLTASESLQDELEDLQARVVALEDRMRLHRANVGVDGNIAEQDIDWIASVDSMATGNYEIAFEPGVFASSPTCVVTPYLGNYEPPACECYYASAAGITCACSAAGVPVETGLFLVCAGS